MVSLLITHTKWSRVHGEFKSRIEIMSWPRSRFMSSRSNESRYAPNRTGAVRGNVRSGPFAVAAAWP